jgi:hypothetical protein
MKQNQGFFIVKLYIFRHIAFPGQSRYSKTLSQKKRHRVGIKHQNSKYNLILPENPLSENKANSPIKKAKSVRIDF